jgi:hypothetical protein
MAGGSFAKKQKPAFFMDHPLINILIRTKPSRQKLFARCMNSVLSQTYTNRRMIISEDVEDRERKPFDYNLTCNDLKARVEDGWFIFVDDDDYFYSTHALEQMIPHLTSPDYLIICHMIRGINRLKHIGMPCFLLHAKNKNVAEFTASPDADYRFISEANRKLKTKFIRLPLVHSPKRGHGK